MSQAKVDYYKEQKAKRKEILEKERKKKARGKAIFILVLVLIVAGIATGIGLTVRNSILKAEAAKPDYTASSLIISDMAGINEEETEAAEEETEQDAEAEDAEASEEEAAEETAEESAAQ